MTTDTSAFAFGCRSEIPVTVRSQTVTCEQKLQASDESSCSGSREDHLAWCFSEDWFDAIHTWLQRPPSPTAVPIVFVAGNRENEDALVRWIDASSVSATIETLAMTQGVIVVVPPPALSAPVGPDANKPDAQVLAAGQAVLTARSLSQRQHDVLTLLAGGHSYDQIANMLDVTVNTVRTHVRAIYERLGVSTKVEAVVTAQRLGVLIPTTATQAACGAD